MKVKFHTSVASPAEEIISLAEREDVSLIAMSCHGTGWLKQLGVGSTTYDVAKIGDRPVDFIEDVGREILSESDEYFDILKQCLYKKGEQ